MSIQTGFNRLLLWLWTACLVSMPVWITCASSGWDALVYLRAIHAAQGGHDPYTNDLAAQAIPVISANTDPPLNYVYPPITLPLLRVVGMLPENVLTLGYWLLYAVCVLAVLWVGMQFAKPTERQCCLFLAPLLPFFPGLLANGVLIGGNIAYILYAGVLLAATLGWRRHQWFCFYAAVLVASCFKPPLLSLAILAPLSTRRQWIPTAITVAMGAAVFQAQALLWPQLFRHYLHAIDLLFAYRRDFGCSPAGLISDLSYRSNLSYSLTAFLYLCYALPLLAILIHFSRNYRDGLLSFEEWLPVLLVGTALVNPRLVEYDLAPATLPLTLIAWRVFERYALFQARWIVTAFLVANSIALLSWNIRKLLDGVLVLICFALALRRLAKLAACPLLKVEPHKSLLGSNVAENVSSG